MLDTWRIYYLIKILKTFPDNILISLQSHLILQIIRLNLTKYFLIHLMPVSHIFKIICAKAANLGTRVGKNNFINFRCWQV